MSLFFLIKAQECLELYYTQLVHLSTVVLYAGCIIIHAKYFKELLVHYEINKNIAIINLEPFLVSTQFCVTT